MAVTKMMPVMVLTMKLLIWWIVDGGWRLLFLVDCGGWMVDGGLTILCFCLAMISSNQTLYGPDVVHLLLHLLILLK